VSAGKYKVAIGASATALKLKGEAMVSAGMLKP